ncbi:response regulator [Clostridium magnum]|uniref:Stage 0 sporulation protein A homolog n=1 Tax=Clostridium magnum DSM 2767 TaxID=1121326 RepID=A0A161WYI6_9CLOT|nr:response regulator [Clostridium magnum]KZL92148.1 response regulator SaeR [Clostridium magnum DSM 2767]SHH20404.1 diguanylate cyclase (GGDEF) domain-containing protein [Clostridium magnum DSM 2767]
MLRNKEVYDAYKNILDIINTLNKRNEKDMDVEFVRILRNTLIKLLVLSSEYNMTNIREEINRISYLLEVEVNLSYYSTLINCLLKCKNHIESVLNRKNVVIFSKGNQKFKILQDMLEKEGFNVFLEGENKDILETIKNINPEVIVVEDDEKNNGMTLFKVLEDDGILSNIPIFVIGPDDIQLKVEVLSQGAVDYLSHKFNSGELFFKIKNISKLRKSYIENSIYDSLTGIYSERYGKVLADKEFERIKFQGGKMNVFMLDMDDMSQINKKKGKEIGDEIIKNCVNIFSKYLTNLDFMYRKSGDEFILVIFDGEPADVLQIGQKIHQEVLQLSEAYQTKISFSGGISFITKDSSSFDDIYSEAYEKLKKAKRSGKSKIYSKAEKLVNHQRNSLLFVDDDKIIMSILTTRYRNKGYEIFSAESGEKALEIFNNNHIDIIITDYYMPNMAGDEFIKRVRRINSKVKIIVLSGQKNEEYIKRALDLGADDYITKPFSPVELDLRIRKFIK